MSEYRTYVTCRCGYADPDGCKVIAYNVGHLLCSCDLCGCLFWTSGFGDSHFDSGWF